MSSPGANRIASERARQKKAEGYDEAHDDAHDAGELAIAASCYAMFRPIYVKTELDGGGVKFWDPWPWEDDGSDKRPPPPKKRWALSAEEGAARIRALEKAGALIAAEIDRLLRLEVA